ncbi:MAG: mitochondrial fission ELM1 family protein [Alphaproteobacteria bacterium]
MNNNKKIWVLADDRIGNVNQALGVAEAVGWDFSVINITYNSLIKLPNFIIGATTLGVNKSGLKDIKEPWPDVVISAGRRSSNLARYIKKQSSKKTVLVQIMYPGLWKNSDFDLIVVPNHDGIRDAANIMKITGSPHRINKMRLEKEKLKWEESFSELPRPYTVLLVGGKTKNKPFTVEMAADLAEKANHITENGSLLITTSRRTGDEQTKALLENIRVPANIYQWSDKTENPYFGYLALADKIIVTGDSVSMCTEACSIDVPVYIYAPDDFAAPKHQRLHKELCEKGYAQMLNDNSDAFFTKKVYANPANEIAKKIAEMVN